MCDELTSRRTYAPNHFKMNEGNLSENNCNLNSDIEVNTSCFYVSDEPNGSVYLHISEHNFPLSTETQETKCVNCTINKQF